ncbi:hypothetical protein HYW59_02280 [Candidatus Kaiserbacteria bacterium]|nr:hypothetical protein [Candidatus Kaiserbacteria bacterium]
MADDLERCAVRFFDAGKGYGLATSPDGVTVFLPASVMGVYENGKIRRPFVGEKVPAPINGDTVVCRSGPNPRPHPNDPNARAATIWALVLTVELAKG